MSNNLQYWASDTPENTVSQCEARTEEYYSYINEKGFRWVWMLVYLTKHNATERSPLSAGVGEYAELQQVRINDYRNLLMNKAGIIKNQRATWEPMAVNSDVKSIAQTKIAKDILEMYTTHKDYDSKLNTMVNHMVDYGEAFALQTWDAFKGKKTQTLPHPSGEPNEDGSQKTINFFEGDVDLRVYEPINVIRDCYVPHFEQNKWFIFRDIVNKWDLAARHPELYSKIVAKTLESKYLEFYTDIIPMQQSTDLVELFTFVHVKSPALPNGRIIRYLNGDIILSADELNYDDIPFHRMVDSPITGQNFAYTDSFDLLEVTDLADGLYSTIITNQRMFGVQNIIMPKGSGIGEVELMGQMNLIEYDAQAGGKPEALDLCKTPAEVFRMLEILEDKKNVIAGVGAVSQGKPPNDVSSGVAISMLQSLNVQYLQGAQASYITAMTSIGTALINILKKNASEKRLLELAGNSQKSLLKEFTGSDVSEISRVVAKPGNPLSQTIQGKFAIAQMIAGIPGLIKNTNDILEVLDTGNLDIMEDGEEMTLLYAQQENEKLRNGEDVKVHPFDDHVAHIKKHVALTQDISVRAGKVSYSSDPTTGQQTSSVDPQSNPEGQKILLSVQQHIMEHLKYAQDSAYQALFAIIGYQPAPQAQPQAAPAPGAQAAAQKGVASLGQPQQAPKVGPSPSNGVKPQQAALPSPTGSGPPNTQGQIPQAAINAVTPK